MQAAFLEAIRLAELKTALAEIAARKAPGSILVEIGGGAGWQARALAAAGYKVRSFDLQSAEAGPERAFPVETYDGHRLPIADGSIDVVFSSNVLEHIAHVAAFQDELHRVLKPDGIAVHILPTATWRLHTLLAHYPWLAKASFGLGRSLQGATSADGRIVTSALSRRSVPQLIARLLISPRHGETGNAITEIGYFSRFRWRRLFARTGWRILAERPNRLYYTGYSLFAQRLPFKARRALSRCLGSACRIYVLAAR